jgi:threonine aldolase
MIDLRSDTLTMPDRAMLEAILTAPLGDDGRTDKKIVVKIRLSMN